jgi:branched-chain amino acid transport system ATP-binding protein
MTTANILLNVNSIEVIYNHVILVLKGVSLSVPEGSIVALLGGNGAGKTTTLRAVSNLLHGERGEVTKGSIECRGERIEAADAGRPGQARRGPGDGGPPLLRPPDHRGKPADRRYTRTDGKAAVAQTLEKVYNYFPRLKTRRTSQAAYTSGGEQQMCAIGRALMANPTMVLLDEPSMGLAPQIVEEVFEIVKDLNQKEKVTFLLAEQNTNMARCATPTSATSSRTAASSWKARRRNCQQRGRQGVLPRLSSGGAQELPRSEALPPPQALARLIGRRSRRMRRCSAACCKSNGGLAPCPAPRFAASLARRRPINSGATMSKYFDDLETRPPTNESRRWRHGCRSRLRMPRANAPYFAESLKGVDAGARSPRRGAGRACRWCARAT